MIRCKRLYDAASPEDGYRILVDRLWPRGVKKTDLVYDEWCKTLTPSNALRKAFHSETIDFAAFSEAYREELEQHQDEGKRIAALGKQQTVTLLYGAKNNQQNHAMVLADWLRQLAEG
ncbi:DUF488 family protein [Enterobacteriaceae bacterium RIT714]|nr:DUF488 family protein [Enterobacteriaceae bacterium RIT714]